MLNHRKELLLWEIPHPLRTVKYYLSTRETFRYVFANLFDNLSTSFKSLENCENPADIVDKTMSNLILHIFDTLSQLPLPAYG